MKLLASLFVAASVGATVAVAKDSWSVQTTNACGDLPCGCTDSKCHDVPGELHFAGSFNSSGDCSATCTAAGAANCSIWVYSQGSQHCWWRLDGTWAPHAQSDIISGCLESTDAPGVSCVPGCGTCSTGPAPAPVARNYSNMNGVYNLSQAPGQDASLFPASYRQYPGAPEYFEVYSPTISTLYSQVFWTTLPTVDLPADVVARFKGKTMAIVGFEMDQVRRTPEGDVRVPINVAYNHHFESTMTGNGARMERIELTEESMRTDPRVAAAMASMDVGHRRPNMSELWVVVPDEERDAAARAQGAAGSSSQAFGAANGGEFRKSYHGYAPGYAQLIQSPEAISITPMQIDTWNRDKMSITGGPFVPGPVPRNSMAPTEGPDAVYSGLLECPVTTRLRKVLKGGSYELLVSGDSCSSGPISTAAECFQAATEAGFPAGTNLSYSSRVEPASPAGCLASVTSFSGPNASVEVVFNMANPPNATAACGADKATLVSHGVAQSLVTLGVTVDTPADTVTLNITGPADVWFGVAFNATQMKDAPWAVVVEPSSGAASADVTVSERQLADQSPGTQLNASLTLVSHTVDAATNTRTVVATRSLAGVGAQYFTFDASRDVTLNFLNAVGSGPKLSYHKIKTAAQLTLLPVGGTAASCICESQATPWGQGLGMLQYTETGVEVGCCNTCEGEPRSDMLAMHNPTCDLRTYTGGQLSCHHMWSLLDADQEIPWPDQPLNYSLKFRFWFQEYNATGGSVAPNGLPGGGSSPSAPSHLPVIHTTWGIASPVEYDIPKCDAQTMGCSIGVDGTWVHTIQGTFMPSSTNIRLTAAHFHCHAPACLSVAMYNNATGELICMEKPVKGTGHDEGNAGFDEEGYIYQPPCLWGDAAFGLTEPPAMGGVVLHVVKTSNATYAHLGEMAWLQMFYINP